MFAVRVQTALEENEARAGPRPSLRHSDNRGGDGASGGERGGERRLRAPLHLSGAGWPGWDCALSLSPARGGIGFSPGNFPRGPGSQREEAAAWPGPDGGDGGAQMLQALGHLAGEPWAPGSGGCGVGTRAPTPGRARAPERVFPEHLLGPLPRHDLI